MKKKKGFTLVELLAVIVILAVILIIAMPKISDVIKNSKESSLETTAKLIASQAEKKYTENQVLDNSSTIKCSDVAKISANDYESCNITFDDKGNAKVSIVGKGKFEGLQVVDGTKNSAKASVKKEIVETAAKYFSYEEVEGGISITGYQIGLNVEVVDENKCKSYLQTLGAPEETATTLCNDNVNDVGDGDISIKSLIEEDEIPSSDYEVAGLNVTYENIDVVIPSQIDGKTVVAIGDNAFFDSNTGDGLGITSVVIPNTVVYIGRNAFRKNELTKVVIPSSVIQMGEYAFADNKLTDVELSDNIVDIKNSTFRNNKLTSIILPKNLTNIYEYAFANNQLGKIFVYGNITLFNGDNFANNPDMIIINNSNIANDDGLWKAMLKTCRTIVEGNTIKPDYSAHC